MSSDNSGKYHQNLIPDANDDDDGMDIRNEEQSMVHQNVGAGTPHHDLQSDMEMMKERFAKLLLGEDMSGGGKEKGKLEPLAPERKARWRKEMDWLLSVTDHIVELVPSQQISKDGTNMEETLDNFGEEQEFWYVSKNENQDIDNSSQRDDKWWHPIVKVPENGLSETSRKRLQYQKESVNQVLKAAMNINAQVLSEIQIPESYIDSLPKNGRESLGDSIYKSITVDSFDPLQFLSAMDFSTEHKVLDFKNRIEASILIWKRKMNQKDGWNPWGSGISSGKRELFEVRAETILLLLKQQFPGVAQSSLDISKIQENRDVGLAIQESYSRVLESLAFSVMSRIEDVLHADSLTRTRRCSEIDCSGDTDTLGIK
ncbi:rop guanine nucleotide exchange factor 9-like [Gossypium australe]|uniref:Rop guanine nucleotide exchange factor 9-like n=1 Tax=Gossypium australe TaxID=47621 RepID=A0A5B6W536_9ROSI|nr:rop guanine nucleotide exchange factor 9-like [Gossypium australe]